MSKLDIEHLEWLLKAAGQDAGSAELRVFLVENATAIHQEITILREENERLERAGLGAVDVLNSGRLEMREASIELLKRQNRLKVAEELAGAVEKLFKVIDEAGLGYLSRGLEGDSGPWYGRANDCMANVKTALAKWRDDNGR